MLLASCTDTHGGRGGPRSRESVGRVESFKLAPRGDRGEEFQRGERGEREPRRVLFGSIGVGGVFDAEGGFVGGDQSSGGQNRTDTSAEHGLGVLHQGQCRVVVVVAAGNGGCCWSCCWS